MNRRPNIRDEMNVFGEVDYETVRLAKNIWRITPPSPAANIYLIRDSAKTILIDSGTYGSFRFVEVELGKLGLRPHDIDLVLNTHEHFDHCGGNPHFQHTALIAAHRSAAAKIAYEDEYVTHMKENSHTGEGYAPHLWLEDGSTVVTGEYTFKILHTPGHTSGSICIYEPSLQILFSGDTVVAGEYLTPVLESGSGSELVSSLERLLSLKIEALYPGHGDTSTDPQTDLTWALAEGRDQLRIFQENQPAGEKRRIQVRADSA